MNPVSSFFSRIKFGFQTYVVNAFRHMTFVDVIDILLLTALLYGVYLFAKKRRAGRMLAGLIFVIFCGAVVNLFRLPVLSFIVQMFASAFFVGVVVVFQPEIRTALEHIGNMKATTPISSTLPKRILPAAKQVTEATVEAVYKMSDSCTGALIVFEGNTKLGDIIETGKVVDARVTSPLLQNIFFDKTPLHDGALIVRNFRILSASCVLPSTTSNMDFGNMGTRHRAAVGVTEISDSLVVVVSEQTGIVSVAQSGKLLRGVDRDTLYQILMEFLAGKIYLKYQHRLEELEEDEDDFDWFDKENANVLAPDDNEFENRSQQTETANTIEAEEMSEQKG